MAEVAARRRAHVRQYDCTYPVEVEVVAGGAGRLADAYLTAYRFRLYEWTRSDWRAAAQAAHEPVFVRVLERPGAPGGYMLLHPAELDGLVDRDGSHAGPLHLCARHGWVAPGPCPDCAEPAHR